MNVLFHPKAREELRQAAEWYEDRREAPDRWPVYPRGERSRRFLLRRFPFAVNYVVVGNMLFIAAVSHLSRRPGYWGQRLKDTPPRDRSGR